jgi:hypothetical protein
MITYKSFILILLIIFIILFFLSLINLVKSSNISGYRVTKIPYDNIPQETINYNNLQHKYDIKKCTDMCKKELCDDYLVQKIKYDLCKECKKEFKCYDPNEGVCKFCLDFRSCDSLYGCNGNELKDPSKNECDSCWL